MKLDSVLVTDAAPISHKEAIELIVTLTMSSTFVVATRKHPPPTPLPE
jgi:hypothetical protein